MSADPSPIPPPPHPTRLGFVQDFRRFFVRGLAAILPTLITLWLVVWVWNFLWNNLGQYIINLIELLWYYAGNKGLVDFQPLGYIGRYFQYNQWETHALGVGLAIILVYIVGVFVGNLIGRIFWRMIERAVMRIPLIRAIYPAVKQVTDFLLAERSERFQGSRVVAVRPHEDNIWSIGLVTNSTTFPLGKSPEEMVTVFVPSTPTSFSGYVLVVPRSRVIELPMTVEEAMRLLVSGGVIMPPKASELAEK